jgi:hypothetical protein
MTQKNLGFVGTLLGTLVGQLWDRSEGKKLGNVDVF